MNITPIQRILRQRAVSAYLPLVSKDADAAEIMGRLNHESDSMDNDRFLEHLMNLKKEREASAGTWAYDSFAAAVRNFAGTVRRR